MRQISRLMIGLSALAFAGVFGASAPVKAQSEAPKPKAEESAEPKREESKDTKREEKTETRDDKTDAKSEQKTKATRDEKAADKKSKADNAAYLRKLAQLIRARSPGATQLGEGSAIVRFRLGASGAPNSVTVVSASTPRHGQLARSIVSGLKAPPPPGGSYDGIQSFRFH
jgi:outer membrane biosynthesis protein TonB